MAWLTAIVIMISLYTILDLLSGGQLSAERAQRSQDRKLSKETLYRQKYMLPANVEVREKVQEYHRMGLRPITDIDRQGYMKVHLSDSDKKRLQRQKIKAFFARNF